MAIKDIQAAIKAGQYRLSDHAVKRMIKRAINRREVEQALLCGEIIERYPGDKYSPSCLIYGKTLIGKALHVQVSLPPSVLIITVYEPDIEEWIDGKIRR